MKKRIISILLLCCMVLTMLPAPAFAADEETYALPPDTDSLCEHHPEHDEACGYTPQTEDAAGTPCGHVCEICESGDGGADPAGPAGTSGAAMSRTLLGAARPAATQYTYTLHYDANGGSGAPPSESKISSEYQASFLISDKIPTRDGYTFKGWADSPYEKPKYLRADGYYWYCNVVNGATNSKTIYAIWEVHNHSWGEWTSNGNGTHKRTCTTDSSHTETGSCSGGKATGTEKAICETCHTAYGELLPLTKTVITTPPTLPSEGYVGDQYLDGDLKGGEAKAQGTDIIVPGSFRFKHNWGGVVGPGENRMEILFTPDDAETYATAECIVTVTGIKYTITSVTEEVLRDEPLGTAFEDLWLPFEVNVKTNTGDIFYYIPVTWDGSSYDPNALGEQIITGELHVERSFYEDELEPTSIKAIARITLIGDGAIVPTLEPPTYSRQIYSGDFCQLAFSDEYLSGGTATADGETVDGVFTLNEEQEKYGYWHRGGGLVQVGLLALKVTFTPYDRLRFSTAECTVNVDVIPRKFRQANTSYIDNKKIGTAFEDLGLPNAFYFFAEADEPNHEGSGLNGSVPGIIKWDDSNYDPNSYEEQTIYGEVNRAEFEKYYIVPEGADLRGVVKITLQADPVETEITQPPVFRWKNGDFTLPNNTMFVNRIFEMGATGGGSANLADGVARVKGTDTVVPGTFSFKEGTPGWFDELGENVVTVVFTPTDQHGYRTAETTIKVNVIKNTFKRCEEPDPITEKKLGTTFAGLNLPEIVVVEAIDGLRVGMEVSWDESSYDAQSTAWQTIPGTLVFDANDEHKYQQPEPAVTAAIRVKLLGSEDAPAITTTTLPGGTVGTPYHHQLQATGGGFILWELFSGELPDGLTLKQTTGEISGTPTAEQTTQFTVRALNSVGNDTKELSITITNAPAAEHTVTVTNDGNGTGAATPSTATAGTTITLTATPNEGYHFKEWEVESPTGLGIANDKFLMPDGKVEIKAIFEKDTPPVPMLEPPAYSKQLYGGDLCNFVFSSLYLSGGKATVNGIEVPGMFTLDQNQEIYGHLLTDSEYLQAGPLGLKVIFTPNDQTKYAAAECTVNVNVIPRKYMYSNARYIDNRKIGTPFAELNLSNSFYFFAVGDENKPEETGMDYGMPVITKWDESSYDPNSYEEQTIYGEVNRAKLEKYFTIPEGADLRGVIKVTLQADPAETEITQLPVLRWKKGEFALPDNTIFVRRQFRAETNGNETTRLVGGVVKVKGTDTVVPGTFSIKQETPDIFSSVGEYDVNVVFTPDDPRAHIPVETSIKINVVKNTLKETVEEAPITNKALGTPFEELGLPESVWAVAVDGYIVYSLDVAWDASSYDAQSPDWQTLTGTLVLSTYKESLYQQPDPAVTAAIRVKLIGLAAAPTIITDALPDGTVGTPYSQRLFANGTEPITWRVVAGELPNGLDLNETTGEISGTPTAAGTASFTVKATNSAGSDTKELSITITKAPAAEYTVTVTTEGGGTASASPAKAAAGTEITLTATPNTGYHFKEWQVESPAGLVITNNKFTMPDSNVAIKAIFEEDSPFAPTKHTVTVKTDGNGIAFASPLLAVAGTEITLTAMPKKGYHFKEWEVMSGGVTIKNNKFIMPSANVEVKAIFEEDVPAPTEFIVIFDGNGGTPSAGSMTTTDQKLPSLPSASRSGSYSFDGWYTKKSGGTKITTNTVFSANTTVYAHWTYTGGGGGGYNPPVTYYTLRFDTGGGSDIPSVQGTYNTYIDLTKYVPTWRGHTFIGWYTERSLMNKVSGIYLTKDMTVYAGWRVDENPGTSANPFTDVSEKDWFYGDVMFVYENGLMLGTSKTLFSPHGTATRGMMATILWRMEGSPVPKGKNSFTDVEAGKWYADAITWTAENGIFAGYGKDKFGPDDPITREQLAAIFYRYADYKGYDLTVKGNLDKFKDADKITDYAKTAMQWAVGSGLVKGKSGNLLDPQGTATRAEIAAMLHRFIEKYELMQGKAPGGLMG